MHLAEADVELATKKVRLLRRFWDEHILPRKATIRWSSFLLLATVVFYWRILLTRQFSLLTESEGVAQAYAWLTFWVSSIRHGVLPLWDPYTLAGHSFVGEMQTAAFYPLHLLLALFPLNHKGVLSPALYHAWFAFAHFLGACFLFALARELRLSRFAAFLAGICFSFGGFVARVTWPHMLESSIWLPLLCLFLLRALRAPDTPKAIRNAAVAGLTLGLSVLAGGMHVVILQLLIVVPTGAYFAATEVSRPWRRAALVIATLGAVGFAAGAVQLLPSMEYSARALRFLNVQALPANQKIPYQDLADELWPQGVLALLIPFAFNGHLGAREVINPYLGVFPLLLAIIGIWRNWTHRWVRFLSGLALAALLFSLGAFSLLHGLLYAVVPRLWMAREADRAVYLVDFALAILVGFGADTLLSQALRPPAATNLNRILTGIVITAAAMLFVPALYGRPEINLWITFSILLIFLSYALFRYIMRGNTGRTAQILIAALTLFDLSAFDWTARNLLEVSRTGVNHLDRLLSTRGAASFLKSRGGEPFRVELATDPKPNIGDAFAIPTTAATGVTLPFESVWLQNQPKLLNTRYRLMPVSTRLPGAVYQDAAWKVYEEAEALPRAWIVHRTVVEPSPERASAALGTPEFDAARTAIVDSTVALDPPVHDASETVNLSVFEPHRLELEVDASSKGLLVLSEMFYPGWYATVNGRPAHIYRADAGLRGIAVEAGQNRVVWRYRPLTVYLGGALTLLAFGGTAAAFLLMRRRD